MSQSRSVHKALVLRNNDPEKLGKIWVKCQTLGAYGAELPFPIYPAVLFLTDPAPNGTGFGGIFFVPEVGTEVEIEVFDGTSDDDTFGESFLIAPTAVYHATTPSVGQDIPAEFKTNYPKRGGIKTAAGHILMFDNTDGKETLQVIGNFNKATQTIITLTKDSITVVNASATMKLNVDTVLIGEGADDHLVRGEDLLSALATGYKAIYDAHVQAFVGVPPGVTSATLAPTTPFTAIPGSVLSPKHKVK